MSDLVKVSCQHEGLELCGELALPPKSGPHPGVLVVHSAYGLGDQVREIARRLADQGYAALAVDMYGGGAYSEENEVIAGLVQPLWGNAERLRERMGIWHEVLGSRHDVIADRIAAIGYCFGGQCVMEMARGGADIQAVVSFHGILTTAKPARRGAIRSFVSVHTGGRDPHAPRSDVDALRDEMIAADASWQITEFGEAYHAFTEPLANTPATGRAYDLLADRLSWSQTLALLDLKLNA